MTFQGPDHMTLHGFLYLPSGHGRFPAIIWNHGSEPKPGWHPELAELYTSKGFVLFIPHRHGQGRSADAGPYHVDLQGQCKSEDCWIGLHELYNKDVIAAVEWLKEQPFVDKDRIAMSGVSYGGIQTLLTAEKGAGIRAFVAFSPGAMSWGKHPDLGPRLLKAERKARRPILDSGRWRLQYQSLHGLAVPVREGWAEQGCFTKIWNYKSGSARSLCNKARRDQHMASGCSA